MQLGQILALVAYGSICVTASEFHLNSVCMLDTDW